MKKMVLLLAGLMLATSAVAGVIDNSAHDFPTTIAGGGAAEVDEICVFCHTPHGSNSAFTGGPLWNRDASAAVLGGVYSSATLNASIDTDYTKIDAAACMSCHDGAQTIGDAALRNPPNAPVSGVVGDYTGTVVGPPMLDNDMSNDHPVNFSYDDSDADDAEINAIGSLPAEIKFTNTDIQNNVVQCSTCHDVHNTVGENLIVINNEGSNLCRACHLK